jgi:hypothetical protein
MKPVRQQTAAELAWNIADLRAVIDVQEAAERAGYRMYKLGQYHDELHACLAERERRTRGRRVLIEVSAETAARLRIEPV